MSEQVLIFKNSNITAIVNNPPSIKGEFSANSIILIPVKSWLKENCFKSVKIIKEPMKMTVNGKLPFTWDEITHLEFEDPDEAMLFKMRWL